MPIRQWFYYDAVEALHDTPLPAEEVAPRGCRYDGQIMVFGRRLSRCVPTCCLSLWGGSYGGCTLHCLA
jgi:ubiquitin-activating enzyme E1